MSVIQLLPTMAPASILFTLGMPKSIGSIQIDAFIDEDHHSQVTVTTMPVEDGSTISDNAVEEPDELTVTGVCGAASLLSPIASISNVLSAGSGIGPWISRPLDVDQALLKLKSARQTVIVVTGLRVYQNMIIEDYRVRRDSKTGAALVFTIQFRQIIIVQSQTATVPAGQIGGGVGSQVQNAVGAGNQPGIQPPDPIKTTAKLNIQAAAEGFKAGSGGVSFPDAWDSMTGPAN